MDDPGRLGRGVSGMDGPGPNFFLTRREVGAESEEVIGGPDERTHARLGDSEGGEEFFGLVLRQIYQVAFDLSTNHRGFAAQVVLGVLAHLDHIRIGVRGG